MSWTLTAGLWCGVAMLPLARCCAGCINHAYTCPAHTSSLCNVQHSSLHTAKAYLPAEKCLFYSDKQKNKAHSGHSGLFYNRGPGLFFIFPCVLLLTSPTGATPLSEPMDLYHYKYI